MKYFFFKIYSLSMLLLMFVGCPYVDHGTSYATNHIVTSFDEIKGCYYRENIFAKNNYRCTEVCMDSSKAFIHERCFILDENGGLGQMRKDTSFEVDVYLEHLEKDGTISYALRIKGVGDYNYYEREDSRELEVYSGDEKSVYSTKGKNKCEY